MLSNRVRRGDCFFCDDTAGRECYYRVLPFSTGRRAAPFAPNFGSLLWLRSMNLQGSEASYYGEVVSEGAV
jgi:hypothetical protein